MYANADVPDLKVQAGMYVESDVAFLGMGAKTKFKLGLDGLEASILFNATELSRVRGGRCVYGIDAGCGDGVRFGGLEGAVSGMG